MADQGHTTQFPEEMLAALKQQAKKTNRSVGGLIREYVTQGLERDGVPDPLPEPPSTEIAR